MNQIEKQTKITEEDKCLLRRLWKFLNRFPEDFADEWMQEFAPEETEQTENIFRKLLGKKSEEEWK